MGRPRISNAGGGDGVLDARVTRIEPAAVTKVSALGIEEQRVKLRLDIVTPAEARVGLGDRFRTYVRIVTWGGDAVLQVPQSALFRQAAGWAVYTERAGRAVLVPVEIGHSNAQVAEVVSGLTEGDRVVAYPGSLIADGSRITARP